MNRNFFIAIPGIVTGIGLLVTFLAILVALLDVRIVDNRVQGIENLIQGLSGKFVSSIAALLAATFFLVCEKWLFHALANSRIRAVATSRYYSWHACRYRGHGGPKASIYERYSVSD
ncbi:MAG: hypothetical protein HY731_02795 [Candidatus Tectomicrobia bacterium]|nr:hypothetical protein [Candidatus Tectomicrobia bacterium]